MWPEIVQKAESLLLVGECNFSFTLSLLQFADNPSIITTTCYETDQEVQPRKRNIELLREKGVEILLGVDATKLGENKNLRDNYDYIIFNFPHIGGKSRIHLNRELLRSFFVSASTLMSLNKSRIIVTLCQGQGGVDCDEPRRPRAYGDTWKVVEMAAYGGLILEKIEPFEAEIFIHYSPSGYGQQGNGGFHTGGSISYIFRKSCHQLSGLPLGTDAFTSQSLQEHFIPDIIKTEFGDLVCSRVHARSYYSKPLHSEPIAHLLEYFTKCVDTKDIVDADEKAPLHVPSSVLNDPSSIGNCLGHLSKSVMTENFAVCTIQSKPAYLRDSLVHSVPHLSLSNSMTAVTGHIFNGLGGDFSMTPVGAEVMFCGDGALAAVLNTLNQLMGGPGNCILRILNENMCQRHSFCRGPCKSLLYEIVYVDQMSTLGGVFFGVGDIQEVCTINLDNVALIIYNANDWRELRTKGCHVSLQKNDSIRASKKTVCGGMKGESSSFKQMSHPRWPLKLIPVSLYPPAFIFDVCFAENGPYLEKDLWYMMWHLMGDVITRVEFLDCYKPPPDKVAEGHRTSWCYRINYCSYEWPLHRKSAVRIQNEVLEWGLKNILGVSMK